MNYAPHYPTPPPGYMAYDNTYPRNTPPMSPGPNVNAYYSPRYSAQHTPSPRGSPKVSGHTRRASHAVPQQSSFASPRGGMPQFVPEFTSPRHYATPRATPEYVSGDFGYTTRPSRHRRDSDATPLKRSHRERKRRPSQSARYVHTKVVYDDYGYGYDYDYIYDSPPPPYEQYARYETYGNADQYVYGQVPIYEQDPKPTRQRRASHSSRPQPSPQTKRPPPPTKTAPKATEEDARRAGIPAGYSYKNWDPTEEPIMLLGSVFDANSLGKWIYDWTVFHYGPATPLAEMAGELWLLLIQLAGKVKRAEEIMPKIRKQENREMVEDFLESGERLWIRFAKLLKVCEDYMWKAAKKETGEKKPISMGKNSGCEFVDSIFGRDRELEKTEKLMTGMRLWSMRFDANCEDILRVQLWSEMEGQQRPPLQSVSGSSNSTSSSSVPSMSTITTPDQTKSPFSTSPSGRVSFVFPQTQRSSSRTAPKATEAVALHELPSTDILPSSSASEPCPGQGAKAIFGPNRLRLVTDDALDDLLGSSPRLGHTIYGRDHSSVQAWVDFNQTSRSKESKRKPDGGEPS